MAKTPSRKTTSKKPASNGPHAKKKTAATTIAFDDISDRKQAIEALRKSEERCRTLLEGTSVCIKIIDLDSRLQYMSSAGLQQLKIRDVDSFYGATYPPEFFPGI